MPKPGSKIQTIRRITQMVFFSFILLLVLGDIAREAGIDIPFGKDLHLICPFGGIATLGSLISGSGFIAKTGMENLPSLIAILVLTIAGGAVFCGWLCPLGSIQEWVGKLGRRFFPKRFNKIIPPRLDRALKYFRYAVLAWILVMTTLSLRLIFKSVDPYYALFHAWTGRAAVGSIVVLGIILTGALFVYRPWCRWFCPMGAVLGLIQKLSPLTIRKRTTCVHCSRCVKACPMGIDVMKTDAIRDDRCNRCMECVSSAENRNCLTYASRLNRITPGETLNKKLSPGFAKAAVLIAVFGAILGFGTLVVRLNSKMISSQSGGRISHSGKTIEEKTAFPEVSGSMTLRELALALSLPIEDVLIRLELPYNYSYDVKLRDIELTYEEKTVTWIRERIERL